MNAGSRMKIKCNPLDLFSNESMPTHWRFQDLTGQTFGRLTVIGFVNVGRGGASRWLCQCSCGEQTLTTVDVRHLKRGDTTSCGCAQIEASTIHGGRGDRLYGIHTNMVERCTNENAPCFHRYGGRGITIADEFRDYAGFRDYVVASLGECPPGYTLDRIDNMRGYEPGNIRWADSKTQNRNTRRNRIVKYLGREMTLAEACERSGLNRKTVGYRLTLGWSEHDALTIPPGTPQVSP